MVAKFLLVVMTQPECFDLLKLSKEDKVVEPIRDGDLREQLEAASALMGVGWGRMEHGNSVKGLGSIHLLGLLLLHQIHPVSMMTGDLNQLSDFPLPIRGSKKSRSKRRF